MTQENNELAQEMRLIDDKLSKRKICLDPFGYYLIKVDHFSQELIVEHYSNDIDEKGTALHPDTGKPLICSDSSQTIPLKQFRGKTAKEVGILLSETPEISIISCIDHAMYLGRELQKAETCLCNGTRYVQD